MNLDALIPPFRDKVEQLLATLASRGVTMRPYSTIRTPWEQARLWRQGRTSEQIGVMTARLRANGATRIARCIEEVGPQHGRKVTNAAPGFSWHNHGEAVDCFRVRDAAADWDEIAYREYARVAREMSLKPGADFSDHPHVQFRHHEPHTAMTTQQIEIAMCERWPTFAILK